MTSDDRPTRPADPTAGEPVPSDRIAGEPVPGDPTAGERAPADPTTAPPAAAAGGDPAELAATQPVPDAATPPPVPDAATLEAIATPAELRRAPKLSAFITTGVLVGVVVGWLLAVLASGTSGEGRTGAILLTSAGLGALGAILGSGLAALADRRSVRRRSRPGR